MDDFLQRLHAHDGAGEPRSEWNSPDDVPPALVAAWRGEPNAYDRLMAVLANNHAGAWYPVLLSAMPFLHDVLAGAPSAGVEAVLGLLDDFVYSFDVDPASPELDRRRELALREALVPIRQTAAAIARADPSQAPRADDLVEGIDASLAGERDRWIEPPTNASIDCTAPVASRLTPSSNAARPGCPRCPR